MLVGPPTRLGVGTGDTSLSKRLRRTAIAGLVGGGRSDTTDVRHPTCTVFDDVSRKAAHTEIVVDRNRRYEAGGSRRVERYERQLL